MANKGIPYYKCKNSGGYNYWERGQRRWFQSKKYARQIGSVLPRASTKTWQNKSFETTTYIYIYRCFQQSWYPQIIHVNRGFRYKPSILGYPYFWKHPYIYIYILCTALILCLESGNSLTSAIPTAWVRVLGA